MCESVVFQHTVNVCHVACRRNVISGIKRESNDVTCSSYMNFYDDISKSSCCIDFE